MSQSYIVQSSVNDFAWIDIMNYDDLDKAISKARQLSKACISPKGMIYRVKRNPDNQEMYRRGNLQMDMFD